MMIFMISDIIYLELDLVDLYLLILLLKIKRHTLSIKRQ